jgi:hypothetical protein
MLVIALMSMAIEQCDSIACVYFPGNSTGADMFCGGSSGGGPINATAPSGGGGGGGATATPGPASTPVPRPGIFQFGTYEFHAAQGGTYGGSVTVTGHVIDIDGTKRVYDLNAGHTRGQEICFGTPIQTDWDWFGGPPGPQQSPYTIAGDGGYAHGLFDCLAGQYILGHFWYWWRNAYNPIVNEIVPPNGDPQWGEMGFTKCLTVIEAYDHQPPPYQNVTFCDVFK